MFKLLTWILVLAIPVFAGAAGITREEALELAFPDATIQSSVVFLSDQEKKLAEENSGVKLPSALVARYVAVRGQTIVGRAYLDTHVVRTKKESLLIILDPDGKVRRVEVVAFLEPPEYQPNRKWYEQFEGKDLNKELQLKRQIHPVTGASLTARATTEAVRRVLAIDRILQQKEAGKKGEKTN